MILGLALAVVAHAQAIGLAGEALLADPGPLDCVRLEGALGVWGPLDLEAHASTRANGLGWAPSDEEDWFSASLNDGLTDDRYLPVTADLWSLRLLADLHPFRSAPGVGLQAGWAVRREETSMLTYREDRAIWALKTDVEGAGARTWWTNPLLGLRATVGVGGPLALTASVHQVLPLGDPAREAKWGMTVTALGARLGREATARDNPLPSPVATEIVPVGLPDFDALFAQASVIRVRLDGLRARLEAAQAEADVLAADLGARDARSLISGRHGRDVVIRRVDGRYRAAPASGAAERAAELAQAIDRLADVVADLERLLPALQEEADLLAARTAGMDRNAAGLAAQSGAPPADRAHVERAIRGNTQVAAALPQEVRRTVAEVRTWSAVLGAHATPEGG